MKYLIMMSLYVVAACNAPDFPERNQFSIEEPAFSGKVVFKPLTTTTGFKVLLQNKSGETLDQTVFRYVPYRFDVGDINRDGNTDILIGLTKVTRFDPQEKKRLFILQIDNNHLRPLWLGSKVCQELVDFKVLKNGSIQTLEQTKTGRFAIGQYTWQSFGITLNQYTQNEIPLSYASQIFAQ
jgi:hypothetical protein